MIRRKAKTRQLTYTAAIHEAIDLCLERHPSVFIIGEGVPDPKGIFGTTLGLRQKYGKERVMDMPVSENALTGVCIGAAIRGLRPIMTHQRMDFSLLAFDQLINASAKWYYMFGGKSSVPLVVRMIVGRGWGQGSQHSQSLQTLYVHIPGLKVVMPTTPFDVKGLLIAAVEDNNPVIFIEHRWLYNLRGQVPCDYYKVKLGCAKIVKRGSNLTIVSTSYMTIESLRAARVLEKEGIRVEIVDVRTLKPLDVATIIRSLKKTGRLLVVDAGWKTLGFASEVIARVSLEAFGYLKSAPVSITLPDAPTPTSWVLAEKYYPTAVDIIEEVLEMLKFNKIKIKKIIEKYKSKRLIPSDVPDELFKGPF